MKRVVLITVLAIACFKLCLGLVVVPHYKQDFPGIWSIGRADNYHSLAKNLSRGHGYRFTPETSLTLMREPGYPYVLSFLVDEFDDYYLAAVALNVLITTLSALLVAHLARYISNEAFVPLIAALLYSFHPGVLIAELRIGVEIPFIFLLLCFFTILRRALESQRVLDFCKVGLALGLTCYVRSTALLFPPFLMLYTFWRERTFRALLAMAVRVAVVMGVTFLVLTPWIVRNYQLVGEFVPTASVQGVAMQVGNYICTHADGRRTFKDLDDDAADVRNEIAKREGYHFVEGYYQFFFDPHDEVKFNRELNQQVVQQYVHSPATFAKCASENVFNFWFTGKNTKATLINMVIQLPYMLLALVGVFMVYRSADRTLLGPMVLFIGYSVAVYAPIHAQARYSVPLVPILAMLAAVPIARLVGRFISDRSPALQPVGAKP
jgi:competence protein ComGC